MLMLPTRWPWVYLYPCRRHGLAYSRPSRPRRPFIYRTAPLTRIPHPFHEAGDVGLKLGYNEADNGYCSFFHVRIPRSHMPSGLSSYHLADQNKAAYGTMTLVRNVWDFPDATLQIALGYYDGNVYERVMQ